MIFLLHGLTLVAAFLIPQWFACKVICDLFSGLTGITSSSTEQEELEMVEAAESAAVTVAATDPATIPQSTDTEVEHDTEEDR